MTKDVRNDADPSPTRWEPRFLCTGNPPVKGLRMRVDEVLNSAPENDPTVEHPV